MHVHYQDVYWGCQQPVWFPTLGHYETSNSKVLFAQVVILLRLKLLEIIL